MTPFVPKKIKQIENLGEELRVARNKTSLSIDEIANILKIKKDYLLALEMENFEALPSGLYGKNYLKKYANFLNIESSQVDIFLKQLDSELEDEDPFPSQVVDKKKFIIFPKIVKNILITLSVLAFFFYLLFYFKNLVVAPNLSIIYPESNIMISETSIEIIGKTDPGCDLSINEQTILPDENGNFNKLIYLKKGMNTISVSARKKYSKENVIIKQVLVN